VGVTAAKSGKYVGAVNINAGTIDITFGTNTAIQANSNISGKHLALRPTTSANGDVIWNCGFKATVGSDPSSGPAATVTTTVLAKYLPASCRT
jgi:hypothetical protein